MHQKLCKLFDENDSSFDAKILSEMVIYGALFLLRI